MIHQTTLREWLEPQHNLITGATWRPLLAVSDEAVLTLAMECANKGDSKSLTSLFEILLEGPFPDRLVKDKASNVTLRVPEWKTCFYDDETFRLDQPFPSVDCDLNGVRFSDAVALCVARHGDHGALRMPHSDEDFRLHAMPHKITHLGDEERRLIEVALEVYRKLGEEAAERNRVAPSPTPPPSPSPASLLFSLCGPVACKDVIDIFLSKELAPEELFMRSFETKAQLGEQSGKNCIVLENALRRGNIEAAHRIMERSVHDVRIKNLVHLRAALTEGFKGETFNFAKIITSLRKELPDDSQESMLASQRYQDLMSMVDRMSPSISPAASGIDIRRVLGAVNLHLDESRAKREPWIEDVAQRLVAPLKAAGIAPGAIDTAMEIFAQDDITHADRVMSSIFGAQCYPALEFLKPALPRILSGEVLYGDAARPLEHLSGNIGWSRADGIDRLKRTVDLLTSVGFDVVHGQLETGDTLLHALARRASASVQPLLAHPMQIEAMLALVDMGAVPDQKNAEGKTPADIFLKDADRLSWETAWRSHVARRAAQAAIAELASVSGARP